MKFGDFLKKQRTSKDWTQPDAAQAIGIEQSYLSKLENGKAIPSAEIFDQLQSAYGFDIQGMSDIAESDLDRLKEIVVVRDFIMRERSANQSVRRRWLLGGLLATSVGAAILTYAHMPQDTGEQFFYYESKGVIKEGEDPFVYTEMPSLHEFKSIKQRLVKMQSRLSRAEEAVAAQQKLVQDSKSALQHARSNPDIDAGAVPLAMQLSASLEMEYNKDKDLLESKTHRLNTIQDDISHATATVSHPLFGRLNYQIKRLPFYRGEFYDVADESGSRRYFLTKKETLHRHNDIAFLAMIGAFFLIGGVGCFVTSRRW